MPDAFAVCRRACISLPGVPGPPPPPTTLAALLLPVEEARDIGLRSFQSNCECDAGPMSPSCGPPTLPPLLVEVDALMVDVLCVGDWLVTAMMNKKSRVIIA